MDQVRRVFVEKKEGFHVEADILFHELKSILGIAGLTGVRIIKRYDLAGLNEAEYQQACRDVFSEPNQDFVYHEKIEIPSASRVFAVEYLPGQYDQTADSAAQCIQIMTQKEKPKVMSARVIVLDGDIDVADFAKIKAYYINSVDSREAGWDKPETLELAECIPEDVAILTGFRAMEQPQREQFSNQYGLAMSLEDLRFCQEYFREEGRDPSLTEIKVIDTYWSDHCRHTTFFTKIEDVKFAAGQLTVPIEKAYQDYLAARDAVYADRTEPKDICLMDIATIGMKELRRRGLLDDLDQSDEINACSIETDVEISDEQGTRSERWLVMFKNETHNHPTEIEPFGGAATCLGGAIRDPLSGRVYVYQAMRLTGSGDPRTAIADTLHGKLPQIRITTDAAHGYSSYGNQIGLATGQVAEVYDPGYIAKRMEIGAVIGAAPKANVVREKPVENDVVVLLGGKTGRDGCGGATGSSKKHTESSIDTCGAEVQKGNPPTERKLQRLFRNPAASRLIKKCNDFGAGGVSVAIGELTDSLEIYLDKVPKKYEGLDGTELAISESQERMAVVIAADKVEQFIELAAQENLEATIVARVTDNNRLKMFWRGGTIVDISRDFLNTNGVKQKISLEVAAPAAVDYFDNAARQAAPSVPAELKAAWLQTLGDLNVCSQRGLAERFDSTIGAASVFMPFGGKYQLTPVDGMAAKIPVLNGETTTATLMTYGYHPCLAKWSPFHGAVYAVTEATAKVAAMGGDYRRIRLTLQEYFEKLEKDPQRWGKPFAALLGALQAQEQLGLPAIGGKDSMSGSFGDLDVPPTLVAFTASVADARSLISPEFKQAGSRVLLLPAVRNAAFMPDFDRLKTVFARLHELAGRQQLLAAQVIKDGGLVEAVSKMCFGNGLGFSFAPGWEQQLTRLFSPDYCSIIIELAAEADTAGLLAGIAFEELGMTSQEPDIVIGAARIGLNEALSAWEGTLSQVFPLTTAQPVEKPELISCNNRSSRRAKIKIARPRVLIPVFPGTNCEYDTAKAFEKAGAIADILVVRNLSSAQIEESIAAMARHINNAQIIALPGGFSAGDEPDGAGKFIAAFFRNPVLHAAIDQHLNEHDGLMLGICNGFQALIKLGLVPYGEIREQQPDSPTLTFNRIGRHMSRLVQTRVSSVLSPWLAAAECGEVHTVAISHGEGRFTAQREELDQLIAAGQIATQYVDLNGQPTYDVNFNPNGSLAAVEGITSPDGRIFGKMGHSERCNPYVAVNVLGNKDQKIFASGVKYFD